MYKTIHMMMKRKGGIFSNPAMIIGILFALMFLALVFWVTSGSSLPMVEGAPETLNSAMESIMAPVLSAVGC